MPSTIFPNEPTFSLAQLLTAIGYMGPQGQCFGVDSNAGQPKGSAPSNEGSAPNNEASVDDEVGAESPTGSELEREHKDAVKLLRNIDVSTRRICSTLDHIEIILEHLRAILQRPNFGNLLRVEPAQEAATLPVNTRNPYENGLYGAEPGAEGSNSNSRKRPHPE